MKEAPATLFHQKIAVNFPYVLLLFSHGTKFQQTYKTSLKKKKKEMKFM